MKCMSVLELPSVQGQEYLDVSQTRGTGGWLADPGFPVGPKPAQQEIPGCVLDWSVIRKTMNTSISSSAREDMGYTAILPKNQCSSIHSQDIHFLPGWAGQRYAMGSHQLSFTLHSVSTSKLSGPYLKWL